MLGAFEGSLLVCCGDMPLMKRATYEALVKAHLEGGNVCTLLSGFSQEPLPYGRVIRDGAGRFARIVEEKDCSPEEKAVGELNAGVYVFEAPALFRALGRLKRNNAQEEYYLTDVPALLLAEGGRVGVCDICSPGEMLGVNTPDQLAQVERRLADDKMTGGI